MYVVAVEIFMYYNELMHKNKPVVYATTRVNIMLIVMQLQKVNPYTSLCYGGKKFVDVFHNISG